MGRVVDGGGSGGGIRRLSSMRKRRSSSGESELFLRKRSCSPMVIFVSSGWETS